MQLLLLLLLHGPQVREPYVAHGVDSRWFPSDVCSTTLAGVENCPHAYFGGRRWMVECSRSPVPEAACCQQAEPAVWACGAYRRHSTTVIRLTLLTIPAPQLTQRPPDAICPAAHCTEALTHAWLPVALTYPAPPWPAGHTPEASLQERHLHQQQQ